MENKLHILLCEDEESLGMLVREYLQAKGYDAELYLDGEAGYKAFVKGKYDMCLLDVMMPKMDGFTMVRQIRQTDQQTPVLFLTARSAIDDVVEGFELGANDYLKKPFGMMELIVRLRSLAGRRQVQTAPAPQTYRIGEFTFHPDTLRLDHAGTSEELSPREAKILELLCASKGETLYTRPLLLEIWGDDDFFNSRSLQVFISKLRRRLEPDPRIRIVNVRGEGYKLLVNE